MPVRILAMATDQSLAEGEIGVGTTQITYPGILQCFAIVGQRGSALIGTHVTPGSRQADIDDTMTALQDIGGDDVHQWYILGPKQIHYTAAQVWKTDKSVKTSFKNTFGSKGSKIMFLDASAERNTEVIHPRDQMPRTNPALDIRVRIWGSGLRFDFRYRISRATALDTWYDFDLGKFKPM